MSNIDYGKVILGNSVETILSGVNKIYPKVSESLFIARIIPLLKNPFLEANRRAYLHYVEEITNPLNVVSDADAEKILFTVPALFQSTGVTIPTDGGFTAENFMKYISHEAERGINVNPRITEFLNKITHRKNFLEEVILPIAQILHRYGETFVIVSDEELKEDPVVNKVDERIAVSTSSFDDEYDY